MKLNKFKELTTSEKVNYYIGKVALGIGSNTLASVIWEIYNTGYTEGREWGKELKAAEMKNSYKLIKKKGKK